MRKHLVIALASIFVAGFCGQTTSAQLPDGSLTGGVPLLYMIRYRDNERLLGVVVPVQIIGDQDGPWDRNAWKTDAFYGNPLKNFAWPPQ